MDPPQKPPGESPQNLSQDSPNNAPLLRRIYGVLVLVFVASVGFIHLFPPLYQHDYYNHLIVFERTMGGDLAVWGEGYPLLFNLLAALTVFGDYGPKVFYSLAYHLWVAWFARSLAREGRTGRNLWVPVAGAALNPLVWVLVYVYGEYDVLIGLLVWGALHVAGRGHDFQAGLLVGVAALLKFGGVLVVLPLLFLHPDRKINWPFVLGAATLVGAVTLVGLPFFGTDVVWRLVNPFLRQGLQSRTEVYAVAGDPSALDALVIFIERIDLYATAALMAAAFYFSWRKGHDYTRAAILQVLVFLAAFKVKNFQFFLWMVPAWTVWWGRHRRAVTRQPHRKILVGWDAWNRAVIPALLVLFLFEWTPHLLFAPGTWMFFPEHGLPVVGLILYIPSYAVLLPVILVLLSTILPRADAGRRGIEREKGEGEGDKEGKGDKEAGG